jgi:integrase/recombinase XerD
MFRAVPVPPELLDVLDLVHDTREARRHGRTKALLWPWSRRRRIGEYREVIEATGIPDGPYACRE